MKAESRKSPKRSYRPRVEALEVLRLLDASSPTIAPISAAIQSLAPTTTASPTDTWDAALLQTQLSDLLGTSTSVGTQVAVNPDDVASGLSQLDRYLSRTWYRAGVSIQQQDDCTQAVYTSLLQQWGSASFEGMLAQVGKLGVREVLNQDTSDGPDFFRAIDTVKKRAQREKTYQTLDEGANIAGAGTDGASANWSSALHEAIAENLNPREAALIHATIQGQTPAEIAQQWGVAPKTVSNEKTRAIQKLRDALTSDLTD